jgi:hypothetical protein
VAEPSRGNAAVAGTQAAWFSPATGRSAPISGLPTDSAGYQFTRVDGGWAVHASSAGQTGCGDCAVPSLVIPPGPDQASLVVG